MVKQELIELWMAEGFLQSDEGNDMESVGDNFVNILLRNSLLQLVPPQYGEDGICVMHDLVHDVASSALSSFKVRYMRHEDESSHIPKESAKKLRTLFIQGKISELKLSDFKCLHVLNFGTHLVKELPPGEIGKLMHLRKLNISKTEIEYLPDSIGELHHSQTLRAYTGSLRKLPKTMKYLISLRHLYIRDDVRLPPKIGKLTSLRTLTQFTVGKERGCQIAELGSLKNLRGKLKILNLENVQGKEEAEQANIFQNPNLLDFKFVWRWERRDEINDENVLEGFQPHKNLKKLTIDGFKGKRFPHWTQKMTVLDGCWVALNNLVEMTLSHCNECEEVPTLGHLPNLKNLYMSGLRNVKSINSSFYGIDSIRVWGETINIFPSLERLELSNMDSLGEWTEVALPENRLGEVKEFPHLEYLAICYCPELKTAPNHFSTCLKELEIRGMNNFKSIANICGATLMSLTSLDISDISSLECLPDWLFHNNQNLSKLKISGCSKLRELPDGLHNLDSLAELIIKHCHNLKSIGNSSGCSKEISQGTLHKLWIEYCEELVDLPHEMVQLWAPSLVNVSLWRLSSLNNLPKVIECLEKSARLIKLEIVGVPKFMTASRVENWPFRSMCRLEIDACVMWTRESCVAIKETVDGMLRGCSQSLVYLELRGLEIWECMPESIQNLTGLRQLSLYNLGMEELPEWLASLTELKELWISGCPKLHIDSKWQCKNLPQLDIYVEGWKIRSLPE